MTKKGDEMTKLYSYVVDHDHGENPNPYGGFCTLVHCKFNESGEKRNLVEMADVGDWVVGTGGKSSESTGRNDRIIYIMRIDEKPPIDEYIADPRFKGRCDCFKQPNNTFALVSKHYCYFGKNAFDISELPTNLQDLCKTGQGYRRDDFTEDFVDNFIKFFLIKLLYEKCGFNGQCGEPCCPTEEYLNQGMETTGNEKGERKPCSPTPVAENKKGGCR